MFLFSVSSAHRLASFAFHAVAASAAACLHSLKLERQTSEHKQSRPAVLQPGAGRCGGLSAPANLRPFRKHEASVGRWHRTCCYSCFHRHACKASPSAQRREEEGELNYGSPWFNREGVFFVLLAGERGVLELQPGGLPAPDR